MCSFICVCKTFLRSYVPDVTLRTDSLELGRCFLNHNYDSVVELVNESDLPAKYELIQQVSLHVGVHF